MSTQYISGKVVRNEIVKDEQDIYSRGIALSTQIKSGGNQYAYLHGAASNTIISSGGRQFLYSKGLGINTQIKDGGLQYVDTGGHAYSTIISSGGSQVINYLGFVYDTKIQNGGVQYVSGATSRTTISRGGCQLVYLAAHETTINSGGSQIVNSSANVRDSIVKKGGFLYISSYASADNVTVSSGGNLFLDNCSIKDAHIKNGAKVTMLDSSFNLHGTNNIFSNIKFKTAYSSSHIELAPNAKIILSGNVDMSGISLTSGYCEVFGQNNKILSLYTNYEGTFHLEDFKKSNSNYILSIVDDVYSGGHWYGTHCISTAKNQNVGTYKILKGVNTDSSFRFEVLVDGKLVGHEYLNESFTKNGVTYSAIYNDYSNAFDLNISLYPGKFYKGTSKSDKITGTADSDIFYGGKNNDTIAGKNGRDVVVYDTVAWGKDVISKTSGTYTLLFNDIKESQINQKISGKDLIISRKNDSKQIITIKNYSIDTHNIVYTKGMTALNTCLKAASPTKKQVTAARNEVWKKAGLASS